MGVLALYQIGNDLQVLKADGCQLVEPEELFRPLLVETGGDPCTTGCAYYENGSCTAFQKYHTVAQEERRRKEHDHKVAHTGLIGGKWRGMSIKEIAKTEGISLNQARKNKQERKYKE